MRDPLAEALRTIHGDRVPLPNRPTPEEYAEVIRRWMPEGSAIEAEARAAVLREVRDEVAAVPMPAWRERPSYEHGWKVAHAAVLVAIDRLEAPE